MLTTHTCEDCARSTPEPSAERQPYCCPICGGKGLVPSGFYLGVGPTVGVTSTSPDQCRSCMGSGIIWE